MSRFRAIAARILPSDRPIGRFVRLTATRIGFSPPRHAVDIINHFARSEPHATFIQIGANDGIAWDPLHEAIAQTQWSGIMVEPVPYVAERLRANMASNPRVTIETVAIAEKNGEQEFYHLAEAADADHVWKWYHALGSFDREVLLSHANLIPDINSRLVTTTVPCVTFDTLWERNGLSEVDVIQIDTEGYDHVVLELIDLERYQPKILMYEHKHLAGPTRHDIEDRLRAHGFEFFSDWMDTIAVSREALKRDPSLAKQVSSAQRANRRHGIKPRSADGGR